MIKRTRIFFDTEFIDGGRTIDLISIGMVREDGKELYLEGSEVDWSKASEWVNQNVRPHLTGALHTRAEIAAKVLAFAGIAPEFWAYFAAYDWVVLCQLYGRMVDLPEAWPSFCRDLRQEIDGMSRRLFSAKPAVQHHALCDDRWVRDSWQVAQALKRGDKS